MSPTTSVRTFAGLDARTAYDLWRLRQAVFVVEQACPYPDLDGRDPEPGTRHVLLHDRDGDADVLVGCARVLDDVDVWRVGRVLLAPSARGRGFADPIVRACLDACTATDPARDVELDAQAPLRGWYESFGFEVSGPEFLEDGIAHLPMRLSRRPPA